MNIYRQGIDDHLLTILSDSERPLSYTMIKAELKTRMNLNHDLSDNTITSHLRKLINEGKITKQVCPSCYNYIDARICYSLTEICKEDMKIKYYKYLPVYISLFLKQYQDTLYDWQYVCRKDLKKLVRKYIGKSLDVHNLRVIWRSGSNRLLGNDEVYTMLYEPIGCLQIQCEEYEFSIANKQGGLNISKRSSFSYRIRGVSAGDVVAKSSGYSRMASRKLELFEIKSALLLLERQGIITKIGKFEGEPRYYIRDPLSVILLGCFNILSDIKESMNSYWKYIKHPASDVRSWLEYFYPQKNVDKIFNDYYSFKILNKKSDKDKFEKIVKDTRMRIDVCKKLILKFRLRYKRILERYKGTLINDIIFNSIEPGFLRHVF